MAIASPAGNIATTLYTMTDRTFTANGTSPVPSASYLSVHVKAFKAATLTAIPLSPAGAALATKTGNTSNWTVGAGALLIPNADLGQQHVLVAWNFSNGGGIPFLASLDLSFFTPT